MGIALFDCSIILLSGTYLSIVVKFANINIVADCTAVSFTAILS